MPTLLRFAMTMTVLFTWHLRLANAPGLRIAVSSTGEVMSGGPSAEEGKRALRTQIEQQAEGKITLLKPLRSDPNY